VYCGCCDNVLIEWQWIHKNTWKPTVCCLFSGCGINAFRMASSNSSLAVKSWACACRIPRWDFILVWGQYVHLLPTFLYTFTHVLRLFHVHLHQTVACYCNFKHNSHQPTNFYHIKNTAEQAKNFQFSKLALYSPQKINLRISQESWQSCLLYLWRCNESHSIYTFQKLRVSEKKIETILLL
jgi:hypothetical protein